MRKEEITFLKGPGHHAEIIQQSLEEKYNPKKITAIAYYPIFSVQNPTRGGFILKLSTSLYNAVSFLVWGFKTRISWLANYQRYLNILFPLFDLLSSWFIRPKSILISWSQVSLSTIKKAKQKGCISFLEHPMIHVSEWMILMEKEYDKHGLQFRDSLFTSSMHRRMKLEYEQTDYINVLSEYAASSFIKHGIPSKKLLKTLPGVDTDFFEPDYSISSNTFIILYAGRLQFLKGVHLLIDAFCSIKHKNAELWLCGTVHEEIKPWLGKCKKIKVFPLQSAQSLKKIYQQASVFVLPSIQEAFGLVILEAMACGTPVIASRATGGPDVIDHEINGLLFETGNKDDLTIQLKNLLNNPTLLASMKIEARKKILQNFQIKHFKHRYLENLTQIRNSYQKR
jgi:starch synthase